MQNQIPLSPSARLIRRVFAEQYRKILTDAELNDIDLTYFSVHMEAIYDIGIYRGINFVLFLFMTLIGWITITSRFLFVVLIVLTIYNLVHLFLTYKRYKQLDRRQWSPKPKGE